MVGSSDTRQPAEAAHRSAAARAAPRTTPEEGRPTEEYPPCAGRGWCLEAGGGLEREVLDRMSVTLRWSK
jgi:hypothetical protein